MVHMITFSKDKQDVMVDNEVVEGGIERDELWNDWFPPSVIHKAARFDVDVDSMTNAISVVAVDTNEAVVYNMKGEVEPRYAMRIAQIAWRNTKQIYTIISDVMEGAGEYSVERESDDVYVVHHSISLTDYQKWIDISGEFGGACLIMRDATATTFKVEVYL